MARSFQGPSVARPVSDRGLATARRISELSLAIGGSSGPSPQSVFQLAAALEDSILLERDASIAGTLAFLLDESSNPQHFFLLDSVRGFDDEDASLGVALARACGRHMDLAQIEQAHLQLTTHLFGPSTHAITRALIDAHRPLGRLPDTIVIHGQIKSLWRALFLDFASEFTREQSRDLCSAMGELQSSPPPLFARALFEQSCELGALMGFIEGAPCLAQEQGLHQIIDWLAMADRFEPELAPCEAFDLAVGLGMPLEGLTGAHFESPELRAHVESLLLESSLTHPFLSKLAAPRL